SLVRLFPLGGKRVGYWIGGALMDLTRVQAYRNFQHSVNKKCRGLSYITIGLVLHCAAFGYTAIPTGLEDLSGDGLAASRGAGIILAFGGGELSLRCRAPSLFRHLAYPPFHRSSCSNKTDRRSPGCVRH